MSTESARKAAEEIMEYTGLELGRTRDGIQAIIERHFPERLQVISESASCQMVAPPRVPPSEFIEQWADKEMGKGNRPCGWPNFGSVSYQEVCKMLESYAGAAPAVSTPPEFEADETPNGTTTFDLKTSAGEFYLETGRTKFSAHFKPISGETQYYEGTMAEAVSTPRCPECHSGRIGLTQPGLKHVYCPECDHTFNILYLEDMRQFFQPAPLPQPSPQCPQCKSPSVGINYAIMFAECYSCGHKSRDGAGVEKFWAAIPSPPQGESK